MKVVNCLAIGKKLLFRIGQRRSKSQNENDQDVVARRKGLWPHIQRWCRRRPFWGALCTFLASILILWTPVCLLVNSHIPANALWAGLVVGGVLFTMGLVELLAPSQALVAGAIGVILSLVSLLIALGGFGIGMFLGVLGSCYAVAWSPVKKKGRRLVFWSVLSCSLVMMLSLLTLVANGVVAMASSTVVPYTTFTGRSECHNIRTQLTVSRVDHRTPVVLSKIDYCITRNNVTTQQFLGRTFRVVSATRTPTITRGITSEVVVDNVESATSKDSTILGTANLEQFIAYAVSTNVTDRVLYSHVDSAVVHDISSSFS